MTIYESNTLFALFLGALILVVWGIIIWDITRTFRIKLTRRKQE